MKFLLGVTHSTRPVDLARNSLNYLQARYRSPSRLENLPPFGELTESARFQPYLGQATFWLIDTEDLRHVHLVARIDPGYKVQHGIYWEGCFVTGGDAVIEIRDREGRKIASASDPWLSGLHTVFPTPEGNLAAACSGSDAVLIFDPVRARTVRRGGALRRGGAVHRGKAVHQGEAVRWLRMPEEIYGRNYPLARTDDTRAHYIHNDLQLTHLNCAFPCEDGIYVSALIQGALGLFSPDGSYREILRGFAGCHGVRRTAPGELLFADSCTGAACFVDLASRQVRERIDFDSRWLHDAEMVGASICAGAVSDRNVVSLYGIEGDSWLGDIPLDGFGASVMFLHAAALEPAEAAWFLERSLAKLDLRPASTREADVHPNVAAFLDERERATAVLTEEIRSRDGILAELQAKALSLQSALVENDRTLREDIRRRDEVLESLQRTANGLQEKLVDNDGTLREEVRRRDRAIEETQQLANRLQAQLVETDESLREEIRRRDAMLEEIQRLANTLQTQLVENDGSLRGEIRRRDAAIEEIQRIANTLQAQLVENDGTLRGEIRQRDEGLQKLQQLANRLQAQLVEEDHVLREELSTHDGLLQTEIDRRDRLLAQAQADLETGREAMDEVRAQVKCLQESLARQGREILRIEEERDGARAEVERLQNEVSRFIEQIEFLRPKTLPQKAASRLLWPRGRAPARRAERG